MEDVEKEQKIETTYTLSMAVIMKPSATGYKINTHVKQISWEQNCEGREI